MFSFQMRTTSNTLHTPLSFHRFSLTECILTQGEAEIETDSHAIVVLDLVIPQSCVIPQSIPKVVFYLKKPPASFFLPRVGRKSRCTDQMHFLTKQSNSLLLGHMDLNEHQVQISLRVF